LTAGRLGYELPGGLFWLGDQMIIVRLLFIAVLAGGFLSQTGAARQKAGYVDVLDLPAQMSSLAGKSPLIAVTNAGDRLVTVGQRGHILVSDDNGHTWQQASVPVSSDLTAVYFPSNTNGWAVGHDGVVLKTEDAGATWTRQIDGREIGGLMRAYYEEKLAENPDDERFALLLNESQRMISEGADKPFLDVWFENERNGYVVGAFNLILRTEDGGQTWVPQQHLVENPYGLHLYDIEPVANDLFIAGEQGLLLKKEADEEDFNSLASPYEGSFFGLLSTRDGVVLAYGLRGNAYRSLDEGGTWTEVDTGTSTNLTAGAISSNYELFLFTQSGEALLSRNKGKAFKPLDAADIPPVAGAIVTNVMTVVVAGSQGISNFSFQQ
jgi:photosystem II stability/assembly factor-like uncharacterized protein